MRTNFSACLPAHRRRTHDRGISTCLRALPTGERLCFQMKGKEKEDFDLFLFVFFLPYFCHRAPALAAGGGEVRGFSVGGGVVVENAGLPPVIRCNQPPGAKRRPLLRRCLINHHQAQSRL